MTKSAIVRKLAEGLDIPVIDVPLASPYAVPVESVLPALDPQREGPLLPFEQRQLQNLLQQVNAAPPRVKAAFFIALTQ